MEFKVVVHGIPRPGGSKKPVVNKKTGKVMLLDASGENGINWRANVSAAAGEVMRKLGLIPLGCPLRVNFEFFMPRPKGHYRTGKHSGELKSNAPIYPTGAPDTTKLIRSSEDACKGILWIDDSLVVQQEGSKSYGPPGLTMTIMTLPDVGE